MDNVLRNSSFPDGNHSDSQTLNHLNSGTKEPQTNTIDLMKQQAILS